MKSYFALMALTSGALSILPASAQTNFVSTQKSSNLPAIVPDAKVMRLDDLGLYALEYDYRDGRKGAFPIGWSGHFEDVTGIANMPVETQNGKRGWLLHVPWRNGVGSVRQTYKIALPKAPRIVLKGAFAMREVYTEKSDGSTFRVFVDGKTLLDEHRKEKSWREFSLDLSEYSGRTIALAFEVDPGAQGDSSFDYSLWGDRVLQIEGFTPRRRTFAPPPALPVASLVSTGREKWLAPRSAFTAQNNVALQNGVARFVYRGKDGTCEYSWRAPRANATPQAGDAPLGALQLTARMKDAAGKLQSPVTMALGDDAYIGWIDGVTMARTASRLEKTARGAALVSRYEGGGKSATLRIEAQMVGKHLVLDATCDAPLVRAFSTGSFGPVMRRREIQVPYYTLLGRVYLLQNENIFAHAFPDFKVTHASRYDSARAIYLPKTDGTYNTLRERYTMAAGWHLAEVLPDIPHPKSPYRREVGGKLLVDNWSGSFLDIAAGLENISRYGVRDATVLVHGWQHHGYDDGLPTHYPANAVLGGDADMRVLGATAKRLGYRFGLHENYVDYYPNYEKFDPRHIMLKSDGTRELAWFNPSAQRQSFAIKAGLMVPMAKTQSPEIHRRYATSTSFLDVHSSAMPWFHVDYDATQKGAAMMAPINASQRALWAFERATHGGPVFGEGANHWMWSGLLDGAEAELRERADTSLLLDFDLLKIHPLQVNQGMGYYERWWTNPNWAAVPPMRVLDRYRMQTLAFGHGVFLGRDVWNNGRYAALEHNLTLPVASRYATANPAQISYWLGGAWRDVSAVLRAKPDDPRAFDRARVRYENGLEITVNQTAAPLQVAEYSLPQYGWLARGAGLLAYSAMRGGSRVDFAQTPTSTFVNPRPAADWNMNDHPRSRAQIINFAQTGPRAFRLAYRWMANETYKEDYTAFVHFSQPSGDDIDAIKMQDDHAPAVPTSQWKIGQTFDDPSREIRLKDDLKDGDYQVSTGLYNAGGRVSLEGEADARGRTQLGVLQVRDNGNRISFVPVRDRSAELRAMYAAHTNAGYKVVDFGSVRSNVCAMIRREGNQWVLQPLTQQANFTLHLSGARFGTPPSVRALGGKTATVKPQSAANGFWKLPVNGAREYRWKIDKWKKDKKN